jgi:hypothetical protein
MQVVPTTPHGGPPSVASTNWGSGNVVDTEIRYGQRSGNIKMKKVRSMDKILRKNGFGGDEINEYEREPLIAGITGAGIIGGEYARV